MAVTDEALALFMDDQQVWSFRWEEVVRVDTYKRDLFAVDMICLDFTLTSPQLLHQTYDEMQGFDELCRSFPSIAPDWWMQVAFPAFATQHSILYRQAVV